MLAATGLQAYGLTAYRGEVNLYHGCFPVVVLDKLGIGVIGTGNLQHEIASSILSEQGRSHLLLDRMPQELQK